MGTSDGNLVLTARRAYRIFLFLGHELIESRNLSLDRDLVARLQTVLNMSKGGFIPSHDNVVK